MNTSDLMHALAERLDRPLKDLESLLESCTDTMVKILDEDIHITIPGLGTFFTHMRGEHKSYDPYHKTYIMVPPKRVLMFHPSEPVKEEVKDVRV